MSLIENVCSVMFELTKLNEENLTPKLRRAYNTLYDACQSSKVTQAERDKKMETWVAELYSQLRANNDTRVNKKEAEKLAREAATADSGITAIMSHLQDTLVDLRVIAPVYASEPTDLFNLTKAVKASFTVDLPDRPNSVIACTNWVKGLHDALLQPANTVKTEDNDQRVSPQEIEKRLTALEVWLARCDRNESTVGLDESLEEDERSKLTEARLQAGVDRANTAQRKYVPQHEGFFSQPASTEETVLSVKIEPMAMAAQQEVMKPDVAEEGTQVVNATPSVTITFDDLFILYRAYQQSADVSQVAMHRRQLDAMIVAYYAQVTRELPTPADVEGFVTGKSQHSPCNISISYHASYGYKLLINDDVHVVV